MEPLSGLLSSLSGVIAPVLSFIDAPAARIYGQQQMSYATTEHNKSILQQRYMATVGMAALVLLSITFIIISKNRKS